MRVLISVITVLIATMFNMLFAQSVQNGVVLEYNGKDAKKPLANVEIVVNNAGSTVTDAEGKFTLNFRTLKPGDHITVRRIEKIGYEIFNTETISQLVITRNNEPITIVLCKTETLRAIRNRYTKIAEKSFSESLVREERVLKNQYKSGAMTKSEYEKKVESLRNKYEEQLEHVENYIERFSHIDLNEINEVENVVVDLVKAGKIEEAISKYDSKKLIDSYRTESRDFHALADAETKLHEATHRKKLALDSLKRSINRQVDLLWVAGGKENFDKVLALLKEVAMADTTDVESLIDYANMELTMQRPEKALEIYQKALEAADNDVVKTAMVNIKRGYTYMHLNQYDDAMYLSMIALHDLDSIVQASGDPDIYLPERCYAQRVIANLFSILNDREESLRYYSYAVQGYEVLFRQDSTTYARDYADAMILYGRTLGEANDTINGEERMKRAIQVYTNLWEKAPERHNAVLAYAYCWLGEMYRVERKYQLSEENLMKSVELYEAACKTNRDTYLGYAGQSYQNLGKLHLWTEEFDKAEKELFMANNIFTELTEKQPDSYMPNLAQLSYNIGSLYYFQNDFEKAAYYDSISVGYYEQLYEKFPQAYYIELATSYGYLGNCYFELKRYIEAEKSYEKMLAIDPNRSDIYNEKLERTRAYIKRKRLR